MGVSRVRTARSIYPRRCAKEAVALTQRNDGNQAIRFRNFDLATLSQDGKEIQGSGLTRSGDVGTTRKL
jgi:hypothetical protein